jgi:diguanylate cyclase (GGDEF)-like protein/PAS domain S-box-containing protein
MIGGAGSRLVEPAEGGAPDVLYQHYVAVALGTTALMLAAIPTVAFAAHLSVSWTAMWSAFGAAAAGASLFAWLLRGPLAQRRGGMVVLYLWSLLDVGALGAVVASSGGEASWFWTVFVLTTIFFSVGYPMRGQLAILTATLLAFVLASLAGTPSVDFVNLAWKMAVLVAVFGMASFPALELRRQTAEHRRARNDADTLSRTLAKQEAWWRSLIDRASDPILVFDSTWRFTFASPAFEALLGYTSTETESLDVATVVHPGDIERVRQAAARVRPDAPVRITCRLQAKDKTWHDVEISLAQVEAAGRASFVVNLHDVTARVAAEAALTHQATHDALTGLANRTAFNEALRTCLAIATRTRKPLAILMLDLENFKQVNDTIGHAAGDRLLIEVGRRLTETLRGADVVARLGGDEFAAVLAVGGDPHGAMTAARRLLRTLDEPVELADRPCWLRGSIGVACTSGGEATRPEQLMQRADRAMYEAKRTGLGVALYDPHMEGTDTARFNLLGELRRGIPAGELRLVYQPKVSSDLTLAGLEALVRWQHPKLGLLPPRTFLPLAEDSGLVHAITDWVLPTALRQLSEWVATGWDASISANVSAQDISDELLPARVESWLRESRVEPGRLTLELTESSAISDYDRGTGALAKLRSLGARVSLDDFGTGYSSLAYLAQLPLDEIKLDRAFLTAALGAGGFLLRSIVDIGHHFGLTVVAEGVETEDVLAQVFSCGCDAVQGEVHFKPKPPDEIAAVFGQLHVPQGAFRRERSRAG